MWCTAPVPIPTAAPDGYPDEEMWRCVALVCLAFGLYFFASTQSFKLLWKKHGSVTTVLVTIFLALTALSVIVLGHIYSIPPPVMQFMMKYQMFARSIAILVICRGDMIVEEVSKNVEKDVNALISNLLFALVALACYKLNKFGFEFGFFGCFIEHCLQYGGHYGILGTIICGPLLFYLHD